LNYFSTSAVSPYFTRQSGRNFLCHVRQAIDFLAMKAKQIMESGKGIMPWNHAGNQAGNHAGITLEYIPSLSKTIANNRPLSRAGDRDSFAIALLLSSSSITPCE